MMNAEQIKTMITTGLDCSFAAIEGDDGVHFTGIVVSAVFEGLSRIRQHQAVYATLGDKMGGEIHALQLQTYTPAQWEVLRASLD